MGLKGNWKNEGYTFKILDSHDGFYQVLAFSAQEEKVGECFFRVNTDIVGWEEIRPDGKTLHATGATVYTEHRRKGLASEMYRLIEEYTNKKIMPGEVLQTEDAKSFWKSR